MPIHLKLIRSLAAAGAVLLSALPAHAEYPDHTIKIVVPFDAGGTVDGVSRTLAERLSAKWKVPVIVENRPGAGNTIGTTAVAKAEPDGYTLLAASTSISVNPSIFKTLPYDTLRDLAPVMYLSPSPNVLMAQKTLGIHTVQELIALAKSRGAHPLTYASVGRGSAHHFCMELLKKEAGIDLLHVPYRGVNPALLAVTRGEVDLYCSDLPGALNLLQGDKMVPLGITSPKRSPIVPNIPTIAEQGLPHYAATGFIGIMTTGGTPPATVQKLNHALNEIVRDPAFVKQFAALGHEMTGGTVESFTNFLKADIERYRVLSAAAGIVPE